VTDAAGVPRATTGPAPTVPGEAVAAILGWYQASGRTLPFRGSSDPYAVLVSEAMAQQTQVSRVGDRWTSFLARFPTVAVLAAASPADVLREWRGLGYNRRALNLWRAARVIVERHDGRVPSALAALEALPGVGPYTARAVAALAFGQPVGAVDTNVRRVLGRIVAGASGMPARDLQVLADGAVPADRPADWTHALMDLGATICRPNRPDCPACPVRARCRYAGEHSEHRASQVPLRQADRLRRSGDRPAAPRFPSTSRWLRGRLLDRLRDGHGDGWLRIEPRIGEHGPAAIEVALAALVADGLVEQDPDDPVRCRLPIG